MTIDPASLYRRPNALSPHYSRFRVADRLLLTGHSHQAWPDCAFAGQAEAWEDAARHVDEKWERAFAKAARVREGYARVLDDAPTAIALAPSTHDLVVRFLSALPLQTRPKIVTTDAEFHTVRRQLDRLAEAGIMLVRVSHQPTAAIAQRLIDAVDDRTAAVIVSSVLYLNAHIVPGLTGVLDACLRVGAELLIDAYHQLNAVPFSIRREGLDAAFVVGGGYKYCQLGEGNCFLRVPPERDLRPVVTGWFAEFGVLTDVGRDERVSYASGPGRFAGATYDPTSHYRAATVFDFFATHALTPELLREVSQHQVGVLAQRFDALDADPRVITRDRTVSPDAVGGFLALRSPHAAHISRALRERGVLTDYRGDVLRLGPAPYLADEQLVAAVDALSRVLAAMARSATKRETG